MSVIQQLKLPIELQELVREFFYYSKIQHDQMIKKKNMVNQLNVCERLYWKNVGQYYDYFYFQIENWGFFTVEPSVYYITQEIRIMSTLFCKHCHNYVASDTPIPLCIECDCEPDWLTVD
jgi:hypothetical protein